MLITSIFSIIHGVFKSRVIEGSLNSGLYVKGLMSSSMHHWDNWKMNSFLSVKDIMGNIKNNGNQYPSFPAIFSKMHIIADTCS